jgi:hypothetical protein
VIRPVKCVGDGFITRTAAANAAMTASQHLEIALTRRPGGDLPLRIMERLTGHPVAGGPARVAVGQTTRGLLAVSAVIMARVMSRVPVVVAIAAESLFLVLINAAVGASTESRRHALGMVTPRLSHRPHPQNITGYYRGASHP